MPSRKNGSEPQHFRRFCRSVGPLSVRFTLSAKEVGRFLLFKKERDISLPVSQGCAVCCVSSSCPVCFCFVGRKRSPSAVNLVYSRQMEWRNTVVLASTGSIELRRFPTLNGKTCWFADLITRPPPLSLSIEILTL